MVVAESINKTTKIRENLQMNEVSLKDDKQRAVAWFVGAFINGEDQMQHFLNEGIWENGYEDKYTDLVNSIKVGDRIAIKSTYTRKNNVPFDNKNQTVSVMGVKAIGIVTHNFQDGKKVSVEWEVLNPVKEWYFYTGRTTIWKVDEKNGWMPKALIDFTFNQAKQNMDKFINDPFWRDRYGDKQDEHFLWTEFYEEMATALLAYKDNRKELLEGIHPIFNKLNMNNPLKTKQSDGSVELLNDICPFTVFGLFNKGITDHNRIAIMTELASFLQVKTTVPTIFDGIPVLNNMSAWFFGYEGKRQEDDIDNLWNLFASALRLVDDYSDENTVDFIKNYDQVITQYGISWNITMGLYWIRPWSFLPLDSNSRTYITNTLKEKIICNASKKICAGTEYMNLMQDLEEKFEEDSYPVHSYPELSYTAWLPVEPASLTEHEAYTKKDFLEEVFISEESYETIKSLLKRKKNLILQGAPGVGKTFAAKRLAYSLMGQKDNKRLNMLQFHQSYSYEDFVMGYRPTESGFELKEGPFYKFCQLAAEHPDDDYYFIIDEINRGNMSKIFGELLMLIESDKRNQELLLTYSDKPFHVPENVYIIGMMNTADRSLAMIDYALRRRFCFFELGPAFETEQFISHLQKQGASVGLIEKIRNKIGDLNNEIENDVNLGKGFRIGHSYFCEYVDSENWYKEIIQYEIEPLLQEYWFDEEEKVKNCMAELLR